MELWIITLKLGLVLLGLLLMVAGLLQTNDRLFSVTVAPEIHAGDIGGRIRRIYLWSVGGFTIVAVAAAAISLTAFQDGFAQAVIASGLALFLLVGAGAAYALGRNIALDYRREDEVRRQTHAASPDPRRLPRPPGVHFLPYLPPVVVIATLAIGWSALPDLFVFRWAADQDDWILVERSLATVFSVPLTVLLVLGLCHLLMFMSRRLRMPDAWAGRVRAMNLIMLLCMMVLSIQGSLLSLVPYTGAEWIFEWRGRAMMAAGIGLLILAPISIGAMRFHRRHFSGLGDRSPTQSWKLGLLYYNPADPRMSAGHPHTPLYASLNFARGFTWLLVAILLVGTIFLLSWLRQA